jgi:hypothetical protein
VADSGGETIPTVIATVRELLGTTAGTIALGVAVFFVIIFKLLHSPMFQAYVGRKATREKALEGYLASGSQDATTKSVVADLRNALMFQTATGIYAEEKWRKGLVKLHDNAGVNWLLMSRAFTYMDIKPDGTVYVKKFGAFDYLELVFNILVALASLASGAFLVIVALKYAENPEALFAFFICGVFLFITAMWFMTQTLPMAAAAKIRR